jgi:DNA-directed RNA polymerase subunit RPC12/RpoP
MECDVMMIEKCSRCGKETENDGTFPEGMVRCKECRKPALDSPTTINYDPMEEAWGENGYYG